MKKKEIWLLLTLLVALWSIPAAAAESDRIALRIDTVEENRITFTVESNCSYENAVAITATYQNGKMQESQQTELDIKAENHQITHSFQKQYDNFKVFLLDKEIWSPICLYGGTRMVQFLDENGDVLEEREVLSGQDAVLPLPPKRDGFVFTGWTDGHESVYADCAVTAQYVEKDADNIFVVSSAAGQAGQEITITVSLDGTVQLCGFDFYLHYDPAALEFVQLDAEQSMDVVANHVAAKNYIRFNYSSTKDRKLGGDVLQITFRLKEDGPGFSRLRLESKKVIRLDPDNPKLFLDAVYTACEGVILAQ